MMTNVIFDMPNRKPVKKDLSEIKEKKDLKNILKEVLQEPKEKKHEK